MNLVAAISIYAGGPGSGCNPDKGKCGRPSTGRVSNKKWRENPLEFSDGYHSGFLRPGGKFWSDPETGLGAHEELARELGHNSVVSALKSGLVRYFQQPDGITLELMDDKKALRIASNHLERYAVSGMRVFVEIVKGQRRSHVAYVKTGNYKEAISWLRRREQ